MMQRIKARKLDNKGFSLIELIVVIAIMVILMAILIPNVLGYIRSARETTDKAIARSLYTAATTAAAAGISLDISADDFVDYAANKTTGFEGVYIPGLIAGSTNNINWTGITIYFDPSNFAIAAVHYKNAGAQEFWAPESVSTAPSDTEEITFAEDTEVNPT